MAHKEHSSTDPFRDFINTLNLDGFTGKRDDEPKSIVPYESSRERKDVRDRFKIGNAEFQVRVNSKSGLCSVKYASVPVDISDVDSLTYQAHTMLEQIVPNAVPTVTVHFTGNYQEEFSLNNAYQTMLFAGALREEDVMAVSYYVRKTSGARIYPGLPDSAQPKNEARFSFLNSSQKEKLVVNADHATMFKPEIWENVLGRHRNYDGTDLMDDSEQFSYNIQRILEG